MEGRHSGRFEKILPLKALEVLGPQRAGGEWMARRLVGPSRGGLVVGWLSAAMRRLSGTP